MPDPALEIPPPNHYSLWIRFVLRILSIRGITWLVLVLSLLATAVVCEQAWRRQFMAREERFEADTAVLRSAIVERVNRYAQILQGAGGLFAASETVEDHEFHAYVQSLELDDRFGGILAIGFIEMVDDAEREEFLRRTTRNRMYQEYPFQIHPPGNRPDYMVVRFVEPMPKNFPAYGFDVGIDDNRRQTAMRSLESNEPALTAQLELVQEPGRPGNLLFKPIYRNETVPSTVQNRRDHLIGWVYAAFLPDDLMGRVQTLTRSKLNFVLYDGPTPSPDRLLSRSAHKLANDPDLPAHSDRLEIYGRQWTLQTQQPANVVNESGFIPVSTLAAGGIGMSLLVFGIAQSMSTTGRRAMGLATDMTSELRLRERELRASEERLEMIIEGSDDGVWDWNMITNAVYFSPRWKGMLGYADDEIENTFESWERLIHPDDRKRAIRVIDAYFNGETPYYKLEHRLRHKDGSYRWILARGVVSRNAAGTPIRMAGSHVDLTELKHIEENLKNANADLQESQSRLKATLADLQASHRALEQTQLELIQAAKLESVGTLAAGVAHEVKNPLQIIVMGIDYLDHRLPYADEDCRITLTDMRDAVLRADSITKELLQFSSSSEFTRAPQDIGTVLERALALVKTDLTRSKVKLVKHLARELPPVLIDAQKVQQVLINLIINALQAMDHVGILTITTAAGRLDELLDSNAGVTARIRPEDEIVMVRIKDTGPGIPDELLPRIFDPFFSTKAVGSGTGLGLSIVKKIIDLHGGIIQFVNSPDSGLVATIAFAAAPPAAPIPENTPAQAT